MPFARLLPMHRRRFLTTLGLGALGLLATPGVALAAVPDLRRKPIPGSGELLPVIGMGTWQTFNVGGDRKLLQQRTAVLRAFFAAGGGLVDCSPMYGSSAQTLGFALEQLQQPDSLFAAEKIWTRDGDATRRQLQEQARAWGIEQFELMQVHNLLNWEAHLPALKELKQAGRIRYLGVTTSHGRRHRELEQILSREPVDFVQLTYNIRNREVEQRLLPLARERGIAVIANRPYAGGHLIKSLQRRARVPEWAQQAFQCRTWADYLLKFLVSHPAVTCAIPATTQVVHMRENMAAGRGPLPDNATRQRMIRHLETL